MNFDHLLITWLLDGHTYTQVFPARPISPRPLKKHERDGKKVRLTLRWVRATICCCLGICSESSRSTQHRQRRWTMDGPWGWISCEAAITSENMKVSSHIQLCHRETHDSSPPPLSAFYPTHLVLRHFNVKFTCPTDSMARQFGYQPAMLLVGINFLNILRSPKKPCFCLL